MKNGICSILCIVCATVTMAQAPAKRATKNIPVTIAATSPVDGTTILQQSNQYAAKAAQPQLLRISDPTVNYYNHRAAGAPRPDHLPAILGVPKTRSGVGRHSLIFHNTMAGNSGTVTGSGAVGTGTTLGQSGTNGAALGVNGKNPYAGPGIYGSRVHSDLRPVEEAYKAKRKQ